MTTLEQLKDAFSWEQTRMAAMAALLNNPNNSDDQNPMKKVLNDAWSLYFKELQDFNQLVMDLCDKVKAGDIGEQTAKDTIATEIGNNKDCSDVKNNIINYISKAA